MTFRKLFGIAAIGGLIYAHRRHGGQMNIESFKQSGRDLLDNVRGKAMDIRSQAESRLHDAADRVASKTDKGFGTKLGEDVTGYGSSGYGYSGPTTRRS